MQNLVKLNPIDSDYNQSALEVARKTNDQNWIFELIINFNNISRIRPWDHIAHKVMQKQEILAA